MVSSQRKGGRTISEFVTLFWIIVAGSIVGFVFDGYRSFRRWQGWGRVMTFVGDILFSLVALWILFNFLLKANALAFRFYIIWGCLLGLFLYLKLLSRFVLRFFFQLFIFISYCGNLIHRGLKIISKGLVILMSPPYALLRWLSLLLYRIGQNILLEPLLRLKKGYHFWWIRMFPPRTKG